MFILFGWRNIVKHIGLVFKKLCDHCHNEEYWVLNRITKWFTLFFIPVIPLNSKYFLVCPVCQYGFNLDRQQIATIRPLAELNQLLIDKKISETEYNFRLNQLNAGNPSANLEVNMPDKENLVYCDECGKNITKDSKFCVNCGKEVVNV